MVCSSWFVPWGQDSTKVAKWKQISHNGSIYWSLIHPSGQLDGKQSGARRLKSSRFPSSHIHGLTNSLSSSWNFPSLFPAYVAYSAFTDVGPVQMTDHHFLGQSVSDNIISRQNQKIGAFSSTSWRRDQEKQIEVNRSICSLKSRPETLWRQPLVAANHWPLTLKKNCLTHLITISSRFCDDDLRAHLAEVHLHPRVLPVTVQKPHSKADARQGEKPTAQAAD